VTIRVVRDQLAPMRHEIHIGPNSLAGDLSVEEGGEASARNPHDLYDAALGACTALTVLWYAREVGLKFREAKRTDAMGTDRGPCSDLVAILRPSICDRALARRSRRRLCKRLTCMVSAVAEGGICGLLTHAEPLTPAFHSLVLERSKRRAFM